MCTRSLTMDLQLNTNPPDPIGFAGVSGFYGPGAWAAWYLTLCASWCRLRSHERFDPNTWLFLAGLNWASFDLLRHLRLLLSLYYAGDQTWTKQGASVGAAFLVVCWGQAHGVAQMFICCIPIVAKDNWARMRRGLTLMIGTIFPTLTMVAFMCLTGGVVGEAEILGQIPALYYKGMTSRPFRITNAGPGRFLVPAAGHDATLRVPGLCSAFLLPFYCVFGYYFLLSGSTPRKVGPPSGSPRSHIKSHFRRASGILRKSMIPVSTVLSKLPRRSLEVILNVGLVALGGVLGMALGLPIFIFLAAFLHNVQVCIHYVVAAYVKKGSSVSDSCVFMPCAPASIEDKEQAVYLFASLFSVVVVEIVMPVTRWIRKKLQEKRLSKQAFELDVERRIGMGASG